ncbi:MAG: CDP-alcohol phosphatidyltransferase family protein [Kiritimatiellia bacterium]|jgi:CDP-diacylglycerol--serine O-phosphatidyltransferase
MRFKRKSSPSRARKARAPKPRPVRRRRLRRARLRHVAIPSIPLRTMAPNAITMAAAGFGILSILLAQRAYMGEGTWRAPLVALFLSGVCDFCDGGVARLLKATSRIGAELDSLADFVNFGVAPAMLTYYWILPTLGDLPRNSWITPPVLAFIAILYAMACVFRLARFNALLEEPTAPRWQRYFMGVPAPGGGYLLLTPLLLWVGFGERHDFLRSPHLGIFLLLSVGALMVSKVPTFALKHFRASRRFLIGATFLVLAGFLVFGFCATVGLVGLLYMLSIPFVAVAGARLPDEVEEAALDTPENAADSPRP